MAELMDAAAASLEEGDYLLAALVDRGVGDVVAGRLVGTRDPEHVRAMLVRFDAEGGHTPGWLVAAIEKRYDPLPNGTHGTPRKKGLGYQAALLEYQQMTGGGSAHQPFSDYFEPAPQEDGSTLFVRREVAS